MTNEELMKQLEDSLRRLIDNSSAAGKLEAQGAMLGLSETDIMIHNAFRANALRHKEVIRVIIKHLIEKVEDHGKQEAQVTKPFSPLQCNNKELTCLKHQKHKDTVKEILNEPDAGN